MGLLVAWASFRLTQNAGHPVKPVLAPFFIAVPVIDCLVVMGRRLARGRSPFSADHGHLHHMLLQAGFRPTDIVVGLCASALVIGFGAAMVLHAGVGPSWFVVAFAAITTGYFVVSRTPAKTAQLLAAWRQPAPRPAPAPAGPVAPIRAGGRASAVYLPPLQPAARELAAHPLARGRADEMVLFGGLAEPADEESGYAEFADAIDSRDEEPIFATRTPAQLLRDFAQKRARPDA